MKRRALQAVSEDSVRSPEPQSVAARALELWFSCGEPVVQEEALLQEAERELLFEQRLRESAARFHGRSL